MFRPCCARKHSGILSRPEGEAGGASLDAAAAAMMTLLMRAVPGEEEGGRAAVAGEGPGESLPAPAEERHP